MNESISLLIIHTLNNNSEEFKVNKFDNIDEMGILLHNIIYQTT